MGIIECEEHGQSAIDSVCVHLDKIIMKKLPIKPEEIFILKIDFLDDGKYILKKFLCYKCSIDYQIRNISKPISYEEFEERIEKNDIMVPTCHKCLREAIRPGTRNTTT